MAPASKTVIPSLVDVLGSDGLLSDHFERYEYRDQQLQMATAVERAIAQEKPLIVEAATGTGKTLAYLVPALRSQKRIVISTGTKALQEQLFEKDIPLLAQIWPKQFDAVLLKGRRNYLCKLRLEDMLMNPRFRTHADAKYWSDIHSWAARTETGDRAEITGLPDDYATWMDLSVSSEGCRSSKCKHYEHCHVTHARRRAQEANLIVVNHHLFFADLALRDTGFAEILPEFDAVIFDEAHHLEEIASNYFGQEVSNYTLSELVHDIRQAIKDEGMSDDESEQQLRQITTHGTSLFTLLAFGLYEGRYPLKEALQGSQKSKVEEIHIELAKDLTALARRLSHFAGSGELSERLKERVARVKFELDALMKADDERYTYMLEVRDRSVLMQAAPIDLAELFRERLLKKHDTVVFTSATLSTGHTFDYFRKRMGMTPISIKDEETPAWPVDELMLRPIFDYAKQCLIYVPTRLPAPSQPEFIDGVVQIVEYLINLTQGSAFVLFTSWANMNTVYERLWERLDYNLLKQGECPKSELLSEFKQEAGSVLFATSSFWEGVDVVGDALKMVIIDKLPFSSPSDPLVSARHKLLESRGGNAFRDYSVPQAALMLKQGFGRLIRSRTDTGVVAILDSRIAHKRYGKTFIDTLPPAPVVWRAADVKQWWHDKFPVQKPTKPTC